MGWFDGSDYDFSGGDSGWDFYTDDYGDNTDGWNVQDWWDNESTGGWDDWTDSSDWSDNYDYVAGDSGGDGSGFNYGALMNYGMQAAAGYASAAGQQKMSKEQLELASKLRTEEMMARYAEEEKYRQIKGKELADAYSKYTGYYVDPNDPANAASNPTNIFGLLTPRPTTGPLANGW